tara:strand:+ start:5049 stop:5801 length:753 start_codon:yes stop_codon:yes gene_type:complete
MNFFNDVVTDMDKLEEEFLGPDYNYIKFINSPDDLGMSSDGSMKALKNDVEGIVSYVELLISGSGRGSKTGKPLGDRFFLKTGGQCKDYKTGKLVQRDMYIDNVPDGTIPGLSEITGMKFDEFKGFIPGIFSNLDAINPLKMFSAFMEGEHPICAEVSLPVIDKNNNTSKQSGHIPITELKELSSSYVTPEMRDALNKSVNKEGFVNLDEISNLIYNKKENSLKQDAFSNIYLISISLLLLYISYKFMSK